MQTRYERKHSLARAFLGGKCAQCGHLGRRLEFDHVDPSVKRFTVTSNLNRQAGTLLAELRKCQLLCRRCHGRKTAADAKLRKLGIFDERLAIRSMLRMPAVQQLAARARELGAFHISGYSVGSVSLHFRNDVVLAVSPCWVTAFWEDETQTEVTLRRALVHKKNEHLRRMIENAANALGDLIRKNA